MKPNKEYFVQYLESKLKPHIKILTDQELDILIELCLDERLSRNLKKKEGENNK